MIPRKNRLLLATIAASAIFTLAAYLAFEDVARDPVPPDDVAGLARWMTAHPGDWIAASVLTDRALDSSLPNRVDLWRASYAHASRLAPARPNAAAAFVRSGLFHWYELGDADRRRVLEASKPLLRDEATFRQLAVPLWLLTRDLALLRSSNPGTPEALGRLRELAITHGLFEDYRALRADVRRARLATFEANPVVTDLYQQVPRPIEAADEPLIRRILTALQQQPLESTSNAAPLIDFALRHNLGPLDGLAAAVHAEDIQPLLRARLARAIGMETIAREIELRNGLLLEREVPLNAWSGTCAEREICTSASMHVNRGGTMRIAMESVQSDEVPPYVEIFVDDALRVEGEVRDKATFEVPLGDAARHKIDVRIANPITRNGIQRRVALSS
jgi:hypothetical protein